MSEMTAVRSKVKGRCNDGSKVSGDSDCCGGSCSGSNNGKGRSNIKDGGIDGDQRQKRQR